ncbi:MAG: hybrid sensor histidine kinase/response regulator [Anaerolineae bacterium]|nr:hybrid sensor histidine kinase/response regulator [Anaerolineae bacterium]
MQAAELQPEQVARAERAGAEEIRHTTLSSLLWMSFAFSSLAWWQQVTASGAPSVTQWLSIAFTLLLLLNVALSQASPRLAGWLFVTLIFSLGTAHLAWVSPAAAALIFVGAALAAGAVLQPRAAPVVGALGAALLHSQEPSASSAALVLALSTGIWLALRPLYDLLWRYSRQTLEAVAMSEQLRDERGKLGRTIKDLNLSYRLLEKTNLELALVCREADILRDLRHRFATNLSHELRTPLNVILGFSRLIYSNPDLYGMAAWPDGLRRDLAELQRNAGYLSRLVDDIVDLARADALALPLQRETGDLVAIAEEAVELVRSLARQKRLELRVEVSGTPPPLSLDPVRIRQVLFNLLTNAIRHTQKGGVVVRVADAGEEVVVSVSDTGSGIPQSELTTIFNEFYQIGRPKVQEDSGKGLGLAIAKRLVQLHGGRIWAESEVGAGSTFSFSLPSETKQVSLGRRPSPTSVPAVAPAVLLLNDDGVACSYLRRRLEGYDFVAVGGPSDLESALEAHRPVAVMVNQTAGAEAFGDAEPLLERLSPDLPLIRCPLPSANWLSTRGSFDAVLTKPVTAEGLAHVMAEAGINGAGSRILVVDDDRGFVQLMRRLIETLPGPRHEVIAAYSGEEALRKLRRLRPRLLLLDLVLPDISGFEVANRLRQYGDLEATRVVAVTAATPGEDQLETGGASFHISRNGPFRPGELVHLIAAGLACATGRLNLSERTGAATGDLAASAASIG